MGFFSEWAEGTNAERMLPEERAAWAQRVPAEWVRSPASCPHAAAILDLHLHKCMQGPCLFSSEQTC